MRSRPCVPLEGSEPGFPGGTSLRIGSCCLAWRSRLESSSAETGSDMTDAADFLPALSCAIERGGTTKPAEKRNATKRSAEFFFIGIDSLRFADTGRRGCPLFTKWKEFNGACAPSIRTKFHRRRSHRYHFRGAGSTRGCLSRRRQRCFRARCCRLLCHKS